MAVYSVAGLGASAETIRISRQGDVNRIEVTVGSTTTVNTTPSVGTLDRIDVSALGGNDTLILDLSGGDPIPGGFVQYDGGSGGSEANALQIVGGANTRATHVKFVNGDKTAVTVTGCGLRFTDADTATSFQSLVLQNGTVELSGGGKSLTIGSVTATGLDNVIDVGAGSVAKLTGGTAFAVSANSRLTKRGAGTLVVDEAQSHGTGSQFFTVGGITNFNTNAGGTSPSKAIAVRASNDGTVVNFRSTQHLNSILIDRGALVRLTDGGAKRLWVDGLDIDLAAGSMPSQLDLGNGILIVDYANQPNPLNGIQNMLRASHAVTGLGGPGIVSTTVREENAAYGSAAFTELALADNALAGYSYIEPNNRLTTVASGNTPLSSTSVVVNFGIVGDANLDGVVNSTDQTALNMGLANPDPAGAPSKRWSIGDFNYSGTINSTDQSLLTAGQTNQLSANRTPIILNTPVPPAQEGGTLRFTAIALDPTMKSSGQTANTLTFSLDSPPSGAVIDSATGDVTWTNVPSGSQSLTVRMTQTGGGSTTRVFSVPVASSLDLAISANGFETSGNGQGLLEVTYALASSIAAPFNIGIFSSDSSSTFSNETRLMTYRVSDPALLAAGTHTVSFRPDFADPDADYFLVAHIDADGEISETNEGNNLASFVPGVFLALDGTIHVHGGSGSDTVKTDATSEPGVPKVYFNGAILTIAGDVPATSLHVRLHDGANTFSDDMDHGNWVFPEWIYGGSSSDTITVRNSYSTVDAGAGTDTVTIAGTSRGDTVDVGAEGIQVNGTGRVVFRGSEAVAIDTGLGDDRIRYRDIPTGAVSVTINAGATSGDASDLLDLSRLSSSGSVPKPSAVTGIDTLDLSHNAISTLSGTYFDFLTDKSTLTALDLRYNRLDLSVGTTLTSVASNLTGLQQLSLYANLNFDANPDLVAMAGKWLRVDLPTIGLDKAELLPAEPLALAAIAKSLHFLPLAVFEYVVNNFDYQPYIGRMKDPLAVIQTHSGNDADLSNLLVELFKHAGIATANLRFSHNALTDTYTYLDAAPLRDWLGTTPAPWWAQESALWILQHSRQAYVYDNDSLLTGLGFDQIWVEVSISGTWRPFNPSYKIKDRFSAIDSHLAALNSRLGTDYANFGELIAAEVPPNLTNPTDFSLLSPTDTHPDAYYSMINGESRSELTHEWYEERVSQWLAVNAPGLSIADLKYDGPIVPRRIASIDDAWPDDVKFLRQVSGNSEVRTYSQAVGEWTESITFAAVDHHRIDVSVKKWISGTSYISESSANGLLIPAISLKNVVVRRDGSGIPQLYIDNTIVSTTAAGAQSVGDGDWYKIEVNYYYPYSGSPTFSSSEYTGDNVVGIGITAGQLSGHRIVELQADVNRRQANALEQNLATAFSATDVGAFLTLAGATYWSRVEQADRNVGNLFRTKVLPGVGIGFLSAVPPKDASDIHSDLTYPIVPRNLILDAEQWYTGIPVSIDPRDEQTDGSGWPLPNDAQRAGAMIVGDDGSAQEHGLWEYLTNTFGMSTIKAFQVARERGISIGKFTLAQWNAWKTANPNTQFPNLSQSVRNSLDWYFANESPLWIDIPLQMIEIEDGNPAISNWIGNGWRVVYGEGDASWIISGSAASAGGYGTTRVEQPMVPGLLPPPVNSVVVGDPVNVATGAAVEDIVDITIPAVGLSLTFSRHYDSNTAAQPDESSLGGLRDLGQGWWHNYSDRLYGSTLNNLRLPPQPDSLAIDWIDSQGHKFTITRTTGGSYTVPADLKGAFSYDATSKKYLYRDRSGLGHRFNADGTLDAIVDQYGNELKLTYANGRMAAIDSLPVSSGFPLESGTTTVASKLQVSYDANGKISGISEILPGNVVGRVWKYTVSQAKDSGESAPPAVLYRFDETSGAVAADSSGNGFDATYVNGPTFGQTGSLGSGTAIALNGTNQYVTLPTMPWMSLSAGWELSFEVWFNAPSGASGVLFSQISPGYTPGGAAPAGWVPAAWLGTDGKLRSSMFWHGGANYVLTSPGTNTYNDGNWHHVVVTAGSSTETLYVDGVAIAQAPRTMWNGGGHSYYIGTGYTAAWPGGNGGWHFFNGKLDHAAIYDEALSATAVTQHYAVGTQPSASASYNFDETSGTIAADASGNGNSATYVNGPTLGQAGAAVGSSAVNLNGSNQYVALPATVFNTLGTGSAYTISFETWFKASPGSSGVILGQATQGVSPGVGTPTGWVPAMHLGTDGKLRSSLFWHGSASNRIVSPGSVTYNDGKWHHVAVSYANGTEVLFIDGKSVGQQVVTQTTANGFSYYLGTGYTSGWTGGNGSWHFFGGTLDNPSIYRRQLTSQEVWQHYSRGAVATYLFDETSGTTAIDSSGSSNNGTYVNGPTLGQPGASAVGTAVSFNGTNQYVQLPSVPFGDYTSNYNLTFETWFNAAPGASGVILGLTSGGTPGGAAPTGWVPAVHLGTDGKVRSSLFWHGSGTSRVVSPGNTVYNDGNWHHVAVTTSGGTEILYLDGVPVGQLTELSTNYPGPYSYYLGTGYTTSSWAGGNSGWHFFAGKLDNAAIYQRALMPADIAEHYLAGKAPSPNPAALYHLDETSNAVPAADASNNGNAATYVNGPSPSQPGAMSGSKAFFFNGVDEYLTLPSMSWNSLAAGWQLSFETWFNATAGTSGVILSQISGATPGGGVPSGYVPALSLGADGKLRSSLFWHGGASSALVSPGTRTYNDGNWHHVVVTTGSGVETLYIDGVAVAQAAVTQFNGGGHAYYVGTGYANTNWGFSSNGWKFFNGKLDEVAIYERVLSPAAVAQRYADGAPGPIAEYRMDDTAGTTAADWSGNGYAATYINEPLRNQAGVYSDSRAVAFDGANDHIELPAGIFGAVTNPSWALSFECWFRAAGGASGVILSQFRDASPGWTDRWTPALHLGTDGKLRSSLFWHGSVSTQIVSPGSKTYNDGNWHHAVVTYANGQEMLYIDGVLAGQQAAVQQGIAQQAGVYYYLGKGNTDGWTAGVAGQHYFSGVLDQVAIYSRALSGFEVAQRWQFSEKQFLTQVQTPEGQVNGDPVSLSTQYSYYVIDESSNSPLYGKLKNVTNPDGGVVRHEYYANGRAFRTVDAEGYAQTFQFDLYRNRTTAFDERGNATTYTYSDKGNPLEVQYADRSRTTQVWDETEQRLISETDAGNLTKTYSYTTSGSQNDPYDNVWRVDTQITTGYDAQGNPERATLWSESTEFENVTSSGKLVVSHLTKTTKPGSSPGESRETVLLYDPAAPQNLVKVVEAGLRATYYTRHASGLATDIKQRSWQRVAGSLTSPSDDMSSDLMSHQTLLYNNAGQVTTLTTDVSQTSSTTTETIVETSEYDSHGYLVAATNGREYTTTFVPDALGRLTEVISPATTTLTAGHTLLELDAFGNVTQSEDAEGRVNTTVFDKRQLQGKTIQADGTIVTSTYDPARNAVYQTDELGRVTKLVYDNRNRLAEVVRPDGGSTVTRYDGRGNVVSVLDRLNPNGLVVANVSSDGLVRREATWIYDVRGLPVKSIGPDPDGNPSSAPTATYGFEETAGNTAADASGHGYAATYVNNTGNSMLTGEGVAIFNGTDQYVSLPAEPFEGLSNESQFSFEIWFKAGADASGVILGQTDDAATPGVTSPAPDYWVSVLTLGSDGKLQAALFENDGSTTIASPGATTYDDDQWHHVAITYANGIEILYIDGQAAGQRELSQAASTEEFSFFLGTGYTGPTSGWQYFEGELYEPAIYRRVLSATTITQHYVTAKATESNEAVTTYQYNVAGDLTATVDPRGVHREWQNAANAYDVNNDGVVNSADVDIVLDSLGPSNAPRTLGRAPIAGVTVAADLNGDSVINSDDSLLFVDVNGDGVVSQEDADLITGFIATTEPLVVNGTAYAYDRLGRVIKMTEPNGLGGVTIDSSLGHASPVWTYGYDLQTSTAYAPESGGLGGVGYRNTVTDPLGRTTVQDFDQRGRLRSELRLDETETLISKATFAYDAADNLTDSVDPRGYLSGNTPAAFTTSYEYDSRNQVVLVNMPDTDGICSTTLTHQTTMAYDQVGNATMTSTGNASSTIDYDDRNRPTEVRRVVTISPALVEQVTSTTYDDAGNVVVTIDPLGRHWQTVFDTMNQPILSIDPLGNRTARKFTDSGQVYSQIDPNGHETLVSYDLLDRVRLQVGADPDDAGSGQSVLRYYWYNAAGDLIQDAASKVPNALDVFQIDAAQVTRFTYDRLGRLTKLVNADPDLVASVNIMDGGALVTASDSTLTSPIHVFRYDALGNKTLEVNPRGVNPDGTWNSLFETGYEYDAFNRLSSVLQPDSDYDPISTTNGPDGRPLWQYQFDVVGNLEFVIDPLNRMTTNEFNALNLKTKTSLYDDALDPAPQANASYFYDDRNNLVMIDDPIGITTQFAYDLLNRRTAVNGEDTVVNSVTQTHVSSVEYDLAGNVVASIDEAGRRTSFEYDGANRLIVTSAPSLADDPRTTVAIYDAVGNQIRGIDALGQVTKFGYDNANRRTSVVEPGGQTISLTYDVLGNLASFTDPRGIKTAYQYDMLNRVTQEGVRTGMSGQTETYSYRTFEYDTAGNQTQVVDRNGRTRTFQFDLLNRLTKEIWVDPQNPPAALNTIVSTYDEAGQLKGLTDNSATYAYTYDFAGRVLSESNAGTAGMPTVALTFEYYANGQRETLQDAIGSGPTPPTRQFQYILDGLGRITEINDVTNSADLLGFAYNDVNQLTAISRVNGSTGDLVPKTTWSYEQATGRLSSIEHTAAVGLNSSTPSWTRYIDAFGYSYDRVDRLTTWDTLLDGTAAYAYDANGQLTAADRAGTADDESYDYDDSGNRTDSTLSGTASAYGYGDEFNQNRLLTDGTHNYTYDGEGNLSTKTVIATGYVTEYLWDHRNRLIEVIEKDDQNNVLSTVQFVYDAFDRRIQKIVDADGPGGTAAVTEKYAYDGNELYLQFDGSNALIHRYIHGPAVDQILIDEVMAEAPTYRYRWTLTDHENSVRDIVDSQGTLINHKAYDSFGRITSESDPAAAADVIFGYTGRQFDDETGLQYNRARYYEADTGRFVSTDPSGFVGGDYNLYRYTENSPLLHTDPMGLEKRNPTSTWYGSAWEKTKYAGEWTKEVIGKGFFGTIGENIYGSGKALITGEAGRAFGERAVKLAEKSGDGRFDGDAGDYMQFGRQMAGEMLGTNAFAEGAVGVDLAEERFLDTDERIVRVASGTSAMAGTIAGGLAAASRLAPTAAAPVTSGGTANAATGAQLRASLNLEQRLGAGRFSPTNASNPIQVGQQRIAVFDTRTGIMHYGDSTAGGHFGLIQQNGLPIEAGRYVGGFLEAAETGPIKFNPTSGTFPHTTPDLPANVLDHVRGTGVSVIGQ